MAVLHRPLPSPAVVALLIATVAAATIYFFALPPSLTDDPIILIALIVAAALLAVRAHRIILTRFARTKHHITRRTRFARAFIDTVGTVLIAVAAYFMLDIAETAGYSRSHVSGWFMLALILTLLLLPARRRLSAAPVGGGFAWMQLHTHLGLLALAAFAMHLHGLPDSPLEKALFWLFVTLTVSGLIGLLFYRTIPKRLRIIGEEVLPDRIPALCQELATNAKQLVQPSLVRADRVSLNLFYLSRLRPYMARSPGIGLHPLPSSSTTRELLQQADHLNKYLDQEGRQIITGLKTLLQQKHQLDLRLCLTQLMRVWIFIHRPLAGLLALITCAHILSMHGFALHPL